MGRPVVITGGGTGGHIFPMQAVALSLLAKGLSQNDVRYVGSRRGQERTLLANDGISLTLLPGRGLRRSFAPRAMLQNIVSVSALLFAMATAMYLIRKWKPSVVVSVGGYASFPMTFAAALSRTPIVTVELDAVPSAAQRLLLKRVTRRCCAFATPGDNVTVTGAPVRDDVVAIDRSMPARASAKAAMSPPIESSRTVIVVMTGSLGSWRVNSAVSDLAATWRSRTDLAVLHVTGRRDFAAIDAAAPDLDGLDYRVIGFGDMVSLWSTCDVAICRAGATTLAEIAVLAVPAVLVPLPNAPGDHQTKNAQTFVDAGAAHMLHDADCNASTLERLVISLLGPDTRARAALAGATLAHADAASRIADVILETRPPS